MSRPGRPAQRRGGFAACPDRFEVRGCGPSPSRKRGVTGLSRGDGEGQRSCTAVGGQVDLGAQPATRASECVIGGLAGAGRPLFTCSGGVLVGPDERGAHRHRPVDVASSNLWITSCTGSSSARTSPAIIGIRLPPDEVGSIIVRRWRTEPVLSRRTTCRCFQPFPVGLCAYGQTRSLPPAVGSYVTPIGPPDRRPGEPMRSQRQRWRRSRCRCG